MIKLISSLRCLLSRKKEVSVTIDVSQDDWHTYKQVARALKKFEKHAGGILELEVVGMSRVHPTVVLAIHDLLSGRPSCVKLHVKIRTNLVDGSLIFPLLADELHVREGAWLQYLTVQEMEQKGNDSEEDGEAWKNGSRTSRVNTIKEPAAVKDYRAMSSLINQYLPLAEFKGKRLPLKETLQDFYLLRSQSSDEKLLSFFEA